MLDKLTYAGNRANLEGVEHEFHQGDIADPAAVATAAEGCEAIVNFAAESHVDRSILGPAEFILTDVLGTQVLLDHARHAGIRMVQVSTDEVYGDIADGALPCTEDAPLRPSSPYSASKTGGDLQVLAYIRTYGVDACITRGANNYGAAPVPGEADPALHHECLRGQGPARLRRRPPAPRVAPCRRLLLGDRARHAQGAVGRDLQRRRPGVREHGGRPADPRPDRRLSGSRPPRRGPPRPRPPLRRRLRRRFASSAGLRRTTSRTAGSRRRSPGTARTRPGGSRSSPASTARTTKSSTASASRG